MRLWSSYRTLQYLLPDQAAFLTAQYDSSLASVPDGDAKTKGRMLGLASANNLIALRTNDGRGASVPYSFPSTPVPGVWILTPGSTAPQTPWVGQMRPFSFDDPARFLASGGRSLLSRMAILMAIPIPSLIQAGCLSQLRPIIRSIRPPMDA